MVWDIGNRVGNINDAQPSRNQSYTYDLLDRLEHTTRGTVTDQYDYDADGNQISSRSGSANYGYTYPTTSNRLSTRTGPDAASSYSYGYDLAGNMTSDGKKNYGYSDGGRLLTVQTLAGVTQHSYYYNAHGQRVAKKGGSVNRRFVYGENGQPLGEYDVAGFYQEHIWLGGEPVGLIRPPLSVGGPRQSFYVLADHLGTPRAVVDPQRSPASKGLVVWRWDGEAFGSTPANPDADGDGAPLTYNLRFPGQYFDPETGRHYNYFRDYDPAIGRYVQSDPIGLAGGINTYGYVGGNPLSLVDPWGLDATNWNNTTGGRNKWDGPTNGNWGGKCWSGGSYSCGGKPSGPLPPTDSADACYKAHDQCYDSPACKTPDKEKNKRAVKSCDVVLVECLRNLPDEPKKWPAPPKPGTEGDSGRYRNAAMTYF